MNISLASLNDIAFDRDIEKSSFEILFHERFHHMAWPIEAIPDQINGSLSCCPDLEALHQSFTNARVNTSSTWIKLVSFQPKHAAFHKFLRVTIFQVYHVMFITSSIIRLIYFSWMAQISE